MKMLPLDALNVRKMASGNLCLELSEYVGWESFSDYAEILIKFLGGRIIGKTDAVDVRLWKIAIGKAQLRLAYDDFPCLISLESSDLAGDEMIQKIYRYLSQIDGVKISRLFRLKKRIRKFLAKCIIKCHLVLF